MNEGKLLFAHVCALAKIMKVEPSVLVDHVNQELKEQDYIKELVRAKIHATNS